ncbi:MAG: phenyltransferase domain-containing protein [Thermodesulfobacteriota bacterium]|nr:phenyltransferase domain-containing protein [Thermodesulfobacteriota bacterium]
MNLKATPGVKYTLSLDIDSVCTQIAETQRDNGDIPWSTGDKTDPWDMVEAAMGLAIGGKFDRACAAYDWLKARQHDDGSWYASYIDGVPQDRTFDTNMSTYIAVGVYHYYLITGDMTFLSSMWDTVRRGIDFALNLQTPRGEIYWAKDPRGKTDPMALLTGSSSIYMSLKCALAIADELQLDMPEWKTALVRLGDAIAHQPHLFNVTKSRFSMDWFYPVLCGAVTGERAKRRLDKHWKKFVVKGLGVRCVSDEPWVTVAESCELVLALSAMGSESIAKIVFNWIQDKCFDDGSYWCGFTFPDIILWPEEKITWTNGVVLMAADALYHLTPASDLFNHALWQSAHPFLFSNDDRTNHCDATTAHTT